MTITTNTGQRFNDPLRTQSFVDMQDFSVATSGTEPSTIIETPPPLPTSVGSIVDAAIEPADVTMRDDNGPSGSGDDGAPSSNVGGARKLKDTKRAAQNRAAQRAFRERKDRYVRELEARSEQLNELLAREARLEERERRVAERERELGLSPLHEPASLPPALSAPSATGPTFAAAPSVLAQPPPDTSNLPAFTSTQASPHSAHQASPPRERSSGLPTLTATGDLPVVPPSPSAAQPHSPPRGTGRSRYVHTIQTSVNQPAPPSPPHAGRSQQVATTEDRLRALESELSAVRSQLAAEGQNGASSTGLGREMRDSHLEQSSSYAGPFVSIASPAPSASPRLSLPPIQIAPYPPPFYLTGSRQQYPSPPSHRYTSFSEGQPLIPAFPASPGLQTSRRSSVGSLPPPHVSTVNQRGSPTWTSLPPQSPGRSSTRKRKATSPTPSPQGGSTVGEVASTDFGLKRPRGDSSTSRPPPPSFAGTGTGFKGVAGSGRGRTESTNTNQSAPSASGSDGNASPQASDGQPATPSLLVSPRSDGAASALAGRPPLARPPSDVTMSSSGSLPSTASVTPRNANFPWLEGADKEVAERGAGLGPSMSTRMQPATSTGIHLPPLTFPSGMSRRERSSSAVSAELAHGAAASGEGVKLPSFDQLTQERMD